MTSIPKHGNTRRCTNGGPNLGIRHVIPWPVQYGMSCMEESIGKSADGAATVVSFANINAFPHSGLSINYDIDRLYDEVAR